MILNKGLHLFLNTFVPVGEVHMKRIVATGFAISPFPPLFESCDQADAGLRHHMVNYNLKNNKQVRISVCASKLRN